MSKTYFPKTIFVSNEGDSSEGPTLVATTTVDAHGRGQSVAEYKLVRAGQVTLTLAGVRKARQPRAPRAETAAAAPKKTARKTGKPAS